MACVPALPAAVAVVREQVRAPELCSFRNGVGQAGQTALAVARPGVAARGMSRRERLCVADSRPSLGIGSASMNDIRAAKQKAPPIMPAVLTGTGPTDLSTLLFRNRIIFLGSAVNSQVAQKVITQLLTLAAIDEEEDIKMYINCPGGSTYSVLAIYDTMSWIKPDVSTVCFGVAASQGALLLAGGQKGKRFAMPNARIMIHQPQGGCGGTLDDVRRQVNEVMASRDKIDKMYSAFTGQPLERVQKFTDRDRFFSAAEAMEFGLIDGLMETEY